jgi:hypothetical protein
MAAAALGCWLEGGRLRGTEKRGTGPPFGGLFSTKSQVRLVSVIPVKDLVGRAVTQASGWLMPMRVDRNASGRLAGKVKKNCADEGASMGRDLSGWLLGVQVVKIGGRGVEERDPLRLPAR